jgi:outer membrane protein assembly factor BamD
MINKLQTFFVALVGFLMISSCSDYQKVLKNEDVKAKYEMAQLLYEQEDYKRASRLYEQILPRYRGKPQGERITFFYANSLLKTKDYF